VKILIFRSIVDLIYLSGKFCRTISTKLQLSTKSPCIFVYKNRPFCTRRFNTEVPGVIEQLHCVLSSIINAPAVTITVNIQQPR
jgi:hypothetical protein